MAGPDRWAACGRTGTDTAGQTDVPIGRAVAAVTGGDGRDSATDIVVTAVRQYDRQQSV